MTATTSSPKREPADPLIDNFVHNALQLVRESTGLPVALVACVDKDGWHCQEVLDDADFGLDRGALLDVRTTY